ncbi:hypothetical protein H4219_004206 [Mycoemilia scoparia]|uniref:Uncharacterized protein n=1 Tax=Mycoemilia scoparia TaxID=417184 RepID=A0A9W7ZSD8_9FUNG|nr:hypothetical protein H4219_004206 [Mycoemilia scoparia]
MCKDTDSRVYDNKSTKELSRISSTSATTYFKWKSTTEDTNNVQYIPESPATRLFLLNRIIMMELEKGTGNIPTVCVALSTDRIRVVENEVPLFHALDKLSAKFTKRRAIDQKNQQKKRQKQQAGSDNQADPQSNHNDAKETLALDYFSTFDQQIYDTSTIWFNVDESIWEKAMKQRLSIHDSHIKYLKGAGKVIEAKAAIDFLVRLRHNLQCWRLVEPESGGIPYQNNKDFHKSNVDAMISLLTLLAGLEGGLGNIGRAALLEQRAKLLRDTLSRF